MINIWNYYDYEGRIKIVTQKGEEYIGLICDVADREENDTFKDDFISIYWNDKILGFFQYEIEKIEKLD